MTTASTTRLLAAGAFIMLSASILFADASSTAAPTQDAPRTLRDQRPTPLALRINNNPFIAFTVPHSRSTAGAIIGQPAPTGPQAYVPGPGGRVIDSPLRGADPNLSANADANSVILCDTWTTRGDRNRTPTAVFLVAGSSVIAVPGDLVGGYRVASVDDGAVRFDGGQLLALGDCKTTTSDANQADDNGQNDSGANAAAPTFPNGTNIAPSAGGAQAIQRYIPPAPVAPAAIGPAPTTTAAPYGSNGSAGYGSTVYGQPAPSSPPYPVALPTRR